MDLSSNVENKASLNMTPSGERLYVGFFGRCNSGKSSLINAFTNQKLSIVSAVKGTTTDPVYKAMELLPIGPIMVVDTPGLDDGGELGSLRIESCKEVIRRIEVGIVVIDAHVGRTSEDDKIVSLLKEHGVITVIAYNKCDLIECSSGESTAFSSSSDRDEVYVSALTGRGIDELRDLVATRYIEMNSSRAEKENDNESESENENESESENESENANLCPTSRRILPAYINQGDIVILVIPIDASAPKGRIILPQQMVIRELLDSGAIPVCCKPTELEGVIERLAVGETDGPEGLGLEGIKLIITDSQAFREVHSVVKNRYRLTSFSILMARYKGDYEWQLGGARILDEVGDGDRILVCEGCTHRRQCEDIGTVKIPKLVREYTSANIEFDFLSGNDFLNESELQKYKLVIHCGGCMLNSKEMSSRVNICKDAGVPITNYGMVIAKVNGILNVVC